MNIDRLRYFAAVVETKNLRRASELLGITPGSLSKALSVLQDEVGQKLIRPEGRGIDITEHGMHVYRSSAVLLDEYKRFMSAAKDRAQAETHAKLRIGSFEVFSTYFLGEFLGSVPDLDALVLELTPGNIEKAILDGLIECGITYIPSPHSQLEFVEIGSFKMGIFGVAKWKSVPFDEWPFSAPITPLHIHSQSQESLDLWPESKVPRRLKYQFEMLETALVSAREGASVSHCPDFIAKLQNKFVKSEYKLLPLPFPKDYPKPKEQKVFLVRKKAAPDPLKLEAKLATFMRQLR